MKRLVILFLMGVLTLAGAQAQVVRSGVRTMRSGARAMRSGAQATSTGQKAVRGIPQQSRWAEQAARTAAAARRLKIKPIGIPVGILNLDNDDNKRKGADKTFIRHLPGFKPIPKIKTISEMEEERLAAAYDSIKVLVNSGVYVPGPFGYFQLADYAMRHNDATFAITCIERIRTDRLTPKLLESVIRRYPSLNPYMPMITRAVVVSAYSKMVDAKMQGTDCVTARMSQGDTLLMLTSQINPALNPLVTLSCVYDPLTELERYKAAADSVIATYDLWSPEFKDTFARHFLITLLGAEETATALDYFVRTPLKEFPDSHVDFALDLADCALAQNNDTLFSEYLRQAVALDSVAAEEYWAEFYNRNWEAYIADPSQLGLADWLIETAPEPANNALLLSLYMLERLNCTDEISWEWEDIADYTPEQATYRAAIQHILDKGLAMDDSLSSTDAVEWCRYIKAEMLLSDPSTLDEGKTMLEAQVESDNIVLRCKAIIALAYIAAHGLDKPKEGLKILKKHIKQLDDAAVDSEIRNMWYDYMAALATRLGKTKDAEKYRKLKETTNN